MLTYMYSVYMYGVLLSTCVVAGRPVKIGILCETDPDNWEYLFGIASAINIAQDKLIERGIVQNDSISSIVWRDTKEPSDGLGNLVELVKSENVDVIFGSPSSGVSKTIGHLTSHWNIPQVMWRGNSFELSNKTLYSTLVRTIGPLSEAGLAIVSLFKKYQWETIGLLYYDRVLCDYVASGIKTSFGKHNFTVMQSISYPSDATLTDHVIKAYLNLFKQSSRIIFMCTEAKDFGRFLEHACQMGMCDGTYLFIYPTMVHRPLQPSAYFGQASETVIRKGIRHMIVITSAEWRNETDRKLLDDFNAQVIERMSEPPWYNDYAKRNNMSASSGAHNLYEATYLYGMWLNYTSEHGLDVKDGAAWLEFSKNKSFESIALPCDIGMNGDRIPYFWFQQYIGEEGDLQTVAISEVKNTKITETGGFRWYTHDGKPPQDSPVCGFFGELCQDNQQDNTLLVLVSALSTLSLFVLVIAIGYAIRKRKLEEVLLQSIWKIRLDDIELHKARSAAHLRSQSVMSSLSHDMSTAPNEVPKTAVAMFKGQTIALRHVTRLTELTQLDMHYLKTMREMQHDNVNPFLGACFDTPSPFILFHYCPKGSLQDILENEEIKLDVNFKYSLTMDLVQGMLYIHNSKLGSHGRLKSSNCLVDNRWMLKVSDFGPASFMNQSSTSCVEEQQQYKYMLWTAPELITDIGHNYNGSKEGDVYSFGIILHEVFYRMGPFAGNEHMTVKEIIHQVQTMANTPCRPVNTTNIDVTPAVVKLMKLCWHDNASERPSFSSIRSFMKKNIQQGPSVNIVDVILQRLEKYASNLEELVDQRTQQLVYEKQKSDKLLYRMLPKTCADKLKVGEQVLPEVFESATVFFSDIVGFTVISSLSTPIEVVDLLNDLYMCFDSIINKYDAYKVETIGDAYLVVSGVPTRNDKRHAGVIANMSLDIVAAVERFKINHLPSEVVRVRIGCHTGPCCAGIVGLTMPKYCLFGDTVNTASRMESNGEAQKIHLSETTYYALRTIGGYAMSFRAEMDIKGKGLMRTYWLESKDCSPGRIMSTGHLSNL